MKILSGKALRCFPLLLVLLVVTGCAHQQKMSESVDLTVEAVRAGDSKADLESAYDLISNIKSADNIIMIYDASGSMNWSTKPDGEPRYKNAHKALSKYLERMREADRVGLIVYGSRFSSGIFDGKILNMAAAKKSCTEDIVVTVPFGKYDPQAFRLEMKRLEQSKSYRGDTPIGNSIHKATDILQGVKGERKRIILVTDGTEECYSKDHANSVVGAISPEEAVKTAMNSGITVSIVAYGVGRGKDGHVVVNPEQALRSLKTLATGAFVVANTGEELIRALMQIEVENFQFDLLDMNKEVVDKFRIGQTVHLSVARYNALVNEGEGFLSKLNDSGNKSKKLKFTIRAIGERNFQKDIGIPMGTAEAKVFLGLKSPFDTDPDIAPDSLKWD